VKIELSFAAKFEAFLVKFEVLTTFLVPNNPPARVSNATLLWNLVPFHPFKKPFEAGLLWTWALGLLGMIWYSKYTKKYKLYPKYDF
jgi:hypothetical protein